MAGLAFALLTGSVAGDSAFQGGIKRERSISAAAKVEGRRVNSRERTGCASTGSKEPRALSVRWRAASRGNNRRRFGNSSSVELSDGGLGCQSTPRRCSRLDRAGERKDIWQSTLQNKVGGLDIVAVAPLRALRENGRVNIFKVVGVEEFSLALAGRRGRDGCVLVSMVIKLRVVGAVTAVQDCPGSSNSFYQARPEQDRVGCVPFWRFLMLVKFWRRAPSRGAKG